MTKQELLEQYKKELQKILHKARDEVALILADGKSGQLSAEDALKIEQLKTSLGVTE